eukprot:scaffold288_cov97-Cylindrotheca_fusiformis.AAC.7
MNLSSHQNSNPTYVGLDVKFSFPFKLHDILDSAEKYGFSSVVSWQPHGKAFRIHKPSVFEACILPKYFEHCKVRSFHRQLHIYGFQRIKNKDSPDYNAFYHELFCRGDQSLSMLMKREKIKGGKKAPRVEPDFYSQRRPFSEQSYSSVNDKLPLQSYSYSSVNDKLPFPVSCPSIQESRIVRKPQSEGVSAVEDSWQRVLHILSSDTSFMSAPRLEYAYQVARDVSNEGCRRNKEDETIACRGDEGYENMVFCGRHFFATE